MDKYEQLTAIRIAAMRDTMNKSGSDISAAASLLGISEDAVCCVLILTLDTAADVVDEVKHAIQCGVATDRLESALGQCVSEKTLQPLKMLYSEKGGAAND